MDRQTKPTMVMVMLMMIVCFFQCVLREPVAGSCSMMICFLTQARGIERVACTQATSKGKMRDGATESCHNMKEPAFNNIQTVLLTDSCTQPACPSRQCRAQRMEEEGSLGLPGKIVIYNFLNLFRIVLAIYQVIHEILVAVSCSLNYLIDRWLMHRVHDFINKSICQKNEAIHTDLHIHHITKQSTTKLNNMHNMRNEAK